ncbi:hypothetical protein C353_04970 [Cryptococcus neoformans AD1-83a]|nr:hypothetical protein C353_04970 [Cryptococcus neoformans var. grubii AD1-83a]
MALVDGVCAGKRAGTILCNTANLSAKTSSKKARCPNSNHLAKLLSPISVSNQMEEGE